MDDPEDRDDKHADDLARLPSLFKEWQGLVVVLGGAVAAVLAVLLPGQTPAAVQVIGYTVAVALVVVGALIFVRVRRQQRARRLREKRREKWEREAVGAHRTAFRGLFPFQEGDELPGEHRQLEARRLVTQFDEPTFSFGVVCGDSGCGKTSLLRSAIQSRLKAAGEEKGFGVLYLSSPRDLADDGSQHADATDIASRLRRELERLRRLAEDAVRGRSLILIIDQFEEFFIEYNSPELRLEIGRFLNGLMKSSPPVRVLCAIRRDYLADMKDLAPADLDAAGNFFEPLSHQGLFKLTNFTVEQAARVIRECAERDRIILDEELAKTLASDLGDGDFVRPPELQIVCTALGNDPTLAGYRLAGGARGILSHHIEDAIEVSGEADMGRRVLRALCDFPTHAKRNPQTIAEIAEAIGAQGLQAQAHVRTALKRFQGARLVVSERRGDDEAKKHAKEEPAYALVHDYLVDAVSQATRDVMTRDEEANQLLDYYVSEYRTDPKTRIPYRRLRFVRRYADPKQLADPTARRLLRASMTRLASSTATLAALVLVATTVLVALTTTSRAWHQEVVGNHWEGNDSGDVDWIVQPNRGLLLTGIPTLGEKDVKLWDMRTASMVYSLKHEHLIYVRPDYILGYSADDSFVTAFHIPTLQEYRTPIPTQVLLVANSQSGNQLFVSSSGKVIAILDEGNPPAAGEGTRRPAPIVRVFSLSENRLIGEMPLCSLFGREDSYISDDGNSFLVSCEEDGYKKPTTFNLRTKERRSLAMPGHWLLNWAFEVRSSRVVSLEASDDGRAYLVLWDALTGRVLTKNDVVLKKNNAGDFTGSVSLTPDGDFFYVDTPDPNDYVATPESGDEDAAVMFYRTSDLQRVKTMPEDEFYTVEADNLADDSGSSNHFMVYWPSPSGGTYWWDLTEPEPRLMKDFTPPANTDDSEADVTDVSLTETGARAIHILRDKNRVELWDFKAGKKLRDLDIPGRFSKVELTIGGNAVSVNVEGGTVSLFRADNGEKITDDIRNVGGTERAIFYDEKCQRVHVWTDEGRVLRYTYGWYIFGRESGFWPAERCEAQ